MPTPQEEQVNANIDLLLQIQLDGLAQDPVAQQKLRDSIANIKDEYREVAARAKTSKRYKDVGDSIAKCLPNLVAGTMKATQAFRKGDYVTGSAALMDIAASVIPVFTSLISAAGPEGALVGALFSVVGQILSFFAPKQPSLEDKIKTMLDHLQSEQQIQNITAVGHAISSYTSSLRDKSVGTHKMEAPRPLAGTVTLTTGSQSVTGQDTRFTSAAEVGEWLMIGADAAATVYRIEAIVDDRTLTLATPYTADSKSGVAARLVHRTTVQPGIAEILALPLTTDEEADEFIVQMKALHWGLWKEETKLDTPVFYNWLVAGYLERRENQRKEGWPEVLGTWCRTYSDLLTANVTLACLADPKTIDRRLAETSETNSASPLPPKAKEKCHGALRNLKALVLVLRSAWQSDAREMRRIVDAITPAARERGLYAHLGHWQGGQVLYVATGDGSAGPLRWDYKRNTAWLDGMSIHQTHGQSDSFTPKYELLVREGTGRIGRHSLDSITGELSDGMAVIDARYNGGERFLDVSGIAFNKGTIGVDGSGDPVTLVALAIVDNGPGYYLNYYTLDKAHKSVRVNTEPRLAGLHDIRVLYLPPTTLPDDPDADAMADGNAMPPGPRLLQQDAFVVYGGVRDRNQIHVVAWNSWATVPGPTNWTQYNGIEVDPYYLWVYGKGGIACASHASMIKCRQGKIAQPTWIYHDFDQQFRAPEVISLSPAGDGSLLVSMLDDIYTADYRIDLSKQRIITSNWTKRGGQAQQVIKMPIPCWAALESLRAQLVGA